MVPVSQLESPKLYKNWRFRLCNQSVGMLLWLNHFVKKVELYIKKIYVKKWWGFFCFKPMEDGFITCYLFSFLLYGLAFYAHPNIFDFTSDIWKYFGWISKKTIVFKVEDKNKTETLKGLRAVLFVDLLLKTSTKIDINCRAKGIRLAIKTHSMLSSRNWVDLA